MAWNAGRFGKSQSASPIPLAILPRHCRADETAAGRLGATVNLPIDIWHAAQEYLEIYLDALESFAAKIRPQLVLISAGFDSHR